MRLAVADFKRCWLDLHALWIYYVDVRDHVHHLQSDFSTWTVNPDWMGAFTDKETVVLNLWESGIPVWHIRKLSDLPADLKIGKRTVMKWDVDIVTQHDVEQPHDPIHTGFGGEARAHLCRPVGQLSIRNYRPLVPTESWEEWRKRKDLPPLPSISTSSTVAPAAAPSAVPPPDPDIQSLLPAMAEQISARVVDMVSKTVSQSLAGRQSRSDQRRGMRELTFSLVVPCTFAHSSCQISHVQSDHPRARYNMRPPPSPLNLSPRKYRGKIPLPICYLQLCPFGRLLLPRWIAPFNFLHPLSPVPCRSPIPCKSSVWRSEIASPAT